jgi:hypothetical protein
MAGRNCRGNDEHTDEHERENQSEHSFERPLSVFFVTLFYRHIAFLVAEHVLGSKNTTYLNSGDNSGDAILIVL